MAKKTIAGRLLRLFGFLILVAFFIGFIVFLYGVLMYFFEGEPLKIPKFSWSEVKEVFDFSAYTGDDANDSVSSEPAPVSQETEPSAPAEGDAFILEYDGEQLIVRI